MMEFVLHVLAVVSGLAVWALVSWAVSKLSEIAWERREERLARAREKVGY